ncbi:MAG: hypothetical protein H0W61_05600 [Bacteroidetes bacterium]|nr:hypothetical protein [Bacteroidota bacterium]
MIFKNPFFYPVGSSVRPNGCSSGRAITVSSSVVENYISKFLILLLLIFFFSSCIKNAIYETQLKSLDSLSGALNQKISELRQVDTIILKKAISKYNNYKQFIQQNVNDTVNKEQANHLQQFYVSGKNLTEFSNNRSTILARGSLLNSQINKLIADVKEQAVDQDKLAQFSSEEKQAAKDLIKASYEQQQLFQANLQEFKFSLSGVEMLIRSRNNGQMPTIIKDSIPL